MRTRIAAIGAAAALGGLGLVPVADAHYSRGWYWSEALAERRVEVRYTDVLLATCTGWGRRYRPDGVRLYKHFDCILELDDGSLEEDEVHVVSRRRFRLVD